MHLLRSPWCWWFPLDLHWHATHASRRPFSARVVRRLVRVSFPVSFDLSRASRVWRSFSSHDPSLSGLQTSIPSSARMGIGWRRRDPFGTCPWMGGSCVVDLVSWGVEGSGWDCLPPFPRERIGRREENTGRRRFPPPPPTTAHPLAGGGGGDPRVIGPIQDPIGRDNGHGVPPHGRVHQRANADPGSGTTSVNRTQGTRRCARTGRMRRMHCHGRPT